MTEKNYCLCHPLFPAWTPNLEGYLRPDVHQRLAAVLCELLAPQISPAYVARMNLYTVADTSPEEDIGILYPDVEVLRRKAEEPAEEYAAAGSKPVTPATITIPATRTVEVRIPVVEIRDRKHKRNYALGIEVSIKKAYFSEKNPL